MKRISRSEKETQAIAARIAKKLRGGETLGLIGDLGAGKTAFTKGLAEAFGIASRIASPTFVVLKVYPVKKHPTIKRLAHVDAYRLKKADSLKAVGLEDYITDPETVTVIEWADTVAQILPPQAWIIRFSHGAGNERHLTY